MPGWMVRSTMAKVFEIRLLHLWECRRIPGEFTCWSALTSNQIQDLKKISQQKYYIFNKLYMILGLLAMTLHCKSQKNDVKFPPMMKAWCRRTRSCPPSVFKGCNGRELRWTRCKVSCYAKWQREKQMFPIFWVICSPHKEGDHTDHNMFGQLMSIDSFFCCFKDFEPPFISFPQCPGGFLFVEISSSTWWHSIRQSWIVYKICRVSKCWQECNVPHKHQDIQIQRKSKHIQHTVDGRNPAPVDMENLSLFTGFYDFIHLKRLFWISSINRIIKQLTFLDVTGS